MFQRPYYTRIEQRLSLERKFIQVLMGPRQVGKTTLVRQLLDKYPFPWHYASADEATQPLWLQQQWEAIRLKFNSIGAKEALLVIDEIQKIPDWSNLVKIQWDKDSFDKLPLKVILLGSSQLMLQKGLSESLAGRFEVTMLPHWSYREMKDAFGFSLEDYIWFGGYPGPADLISDENRWKEYIRHSLVETTIMRDILLLTRIDKPVLLRNLFDLACSWSGQILSYNKILGQLKDAGNTTTLAHYLKLLEGAGMIKGLEKFSTSTIRQRASSPKFQVFNTALMSAISPNQRQEIAEQPEIYGRWVESAIGSHLLNQSLTEQINLYYWREGNHEVDFVLQKGDKTFGIVVKSGRNKSSSGIPEFTKRFNPGKVLLVGREGIPFEEFLMIPVADLIS
ncbi:MAG: ATP-binding protein [Bacteroidales bacterium]|nr:ATP-binding protein [Bacteroidales bacterium]